MRLSGEQPKQAEPVKRLVSQYAFSRIDLMVVIVTILLLGVWFGFIHLGERGRITHCQANLAALGRAMQGYANDNNGAIPAAGINLGKLQATWDMKLFSYLKPGLAKANSDQLFEIAPRFFACPSDKVPHKKTLRSYAMGGNDMLSEHWPPGRDSATGVGLFWNKQTVLSLLDDAALKTPDSLPSVKLSSVPVPVDTVLLAEFIAPNNTMGSLWQVTVSGVSQQQQFFKDGGVSFHNGRFNYLMADGHVESLSPLQTGSLDGSSGVWSLKKR